MLPDLSLTAVVSDREITLNATGRPTVLIFHGQDTARAAIQVNNTVRTAFASPDQVLIASIIDLRQFPQMFHAMVRPELEKAYRKAADKLPAGADPAEFVVLLPDWQGSAHKACGVAGSTDEAVALVADTGGRIVTRVQGAELDQAVLTALQGL